MRGQQAGGAAMIERGLQRDGVLHERPRHEPMTGFFAPGDTTFSCQNNALLMVWTLWGNVPGVRRSCGPLTFGSVACHCFGESR